MFVDRYHPLRRPFTELVARRFYGDAGVRDPSAVDYVSTVLSNFAHVENLYRIRDARGKRLEEVGEMLIESNPLLEGRSFDREREVGKGASYGNAGCIAPGHHRSTSRAASGRLSNRCLIHSAPCMLLRGQIPPLQSGSGHLAEPAPTGIWNSLCAPWRHSATPPGGCSTN